MATRIPEDQIPDEPWADRELLEQAYRERGLSPWAIAYELGVSKSHITVYLERYGITRKHRHEPTLRHLHIEEGLSADEIAARDEFACSPVTVRKWLARHDLIDDDPDAITYGRLDGLGSESSAPTA